MLEQQIAAGVEAEAAKSRPVYDQVFQKTVSLMHPFTLAGRRYSVVLVKPCSVGEFSAARDADRRIPIFYDEAGVLLPDDVVDALSLRDSARVNEAAADFLPVDSDSTETSSPSEDGKAQPGQ